GLGLGLAVVQRIVTLHGGRVTAASAGHDRGSEFVVELPLARADDVKQAGPAEIVPTIRSYQVLVVEDHDDARESLRLLLTTAGHVVRVAADAIEGLEILRSWRPDVSIVDIGLPGLDGYGFGRAVLADPALASIPLVAVTGYGQPHDREQAIQVGFR